MSLNDLKPSNSLMASETSVKSFMRFLADEGVALAVVDDAVRTDASGATLIALVDRFGLYLAQLKAKDGSALKKNTVGQYFRQTKLWMLERFPQFANLVDSAILARGRILKRYSGMRPGSMLVKQAAAYTKQNLYSLLNYIYSTATTAVDYQDAALLTMLWACRSAVRFVRFLRMNTAEKQGLTLFPDDGLTTCPLTAMAIALVLQTAPSPQLLPHLPKPTQIDLAVHSPLVPLSAVLHGCTDGRSLLAEAARAGGGDNEHPHLATPARTSTTQLPGIHAYVNRVLSRISEGAKISTALMSHSFRRGGAQHVNGYPGISPQWIADRGGWNMTTTNKVFSYIFNTTQEDQKVLSGHEVDARVKLVDLSAFDSSTHASVAALQIDLFANCIGLQDSTLNVSSQVLDVMLAHLLKAYPQHRAINPVSPLVARVEQAMKRVGVGLEQILGWSIHLANTATAPSTTNDTPDTKHLQMIEHQAAVIDQLIDVAKAQAERLRDIETKIGAENNEPEPGSTLKRSRDESEVVNTPKRRKRKSTNLWETWYAWFACQEYVTETDRHWKSTMRRCVACMKLFTDSLEHDSNDDGFREQVLMTGKQVAVNVQLFLTRHAIVCTSTGAVEKKFRELHKAGKLNTLIAEYDARVLVGLIRNPTPHAHQPDRLKLSPISSVARDPADSTVHQG